MSDDRLPPHDLEAEKATLGCVLLNWQDSMPVCIELIGSKHDIFYDLKHKEIYRVMVEMYDAQEAIDLVTLSSWLSFQTLLDTVGGLAFLETLPDAAPSAANLTYYLGILDDKYKARRLIRICAEQASGAFDNAAQPDALISKAATDILALAEDSIPKHDEATIQQLVPEALTQIETWHTAQGVCNGIATGFDDLDAMTTGLHGGEMIVIAGRPGIGKSSLAMNIVDHAAVELGFPVGVFSLEMTKLSLVTRMICSRSRLNARRVQAGILNANDFPKIVAAAGRLNSSHVYINDQSSMSIMGLRSRARRMSQQYGIKLLVIDYLQLMTAERSRNDNREQEVSFISRGIKGIAKELDIPVIALSQLNRTLEKDKDRRPRLSDLRESGAIENDADFVGILWKPRQDNEESDDGEAVPVNLEVCKQRNGPTGTVKFTFLRELTRFETAAYTSAPAEQEEPEQQQQFPT